MSLSGVESATVELDRLSGKQVACEARSEDLGCATVGQVMSIVVK
jgi:hypothetical protein